MKTRPRSLVFVAVFLLTIAVSFPLQIALLYDHSLLELEAIFAKLAPMNWMILFFAPLTAYLVYQASALTLFTVPVLITLVLHNNWFVAELGTDYSSLAAGFASAGFLICLTPLVGYRELIMNPERRWWRTPLRARVRFPIHMQLGGKGITAQEISTSTFDLSEGGAFLSNTSLPVGAYCKVRLDFEDEQINCRAEIVRKALSQGTYPSGIGIRFLDLTWKQRRKIQAMLEHREEPKNALAA